MKRKIQNGTSVCLTLLLLFALLPLGVIAESQETIDKTIVSETSSTAEAIVQANDSSNVNIEFTSNLQNGIQISYLNASRNEDKIVFTFEYYSPQNYDYSFFNPPSGSSIIKRIYDGIQAGTHTTTLELSLYDFKNVMANESITMRFDFNDDAPRTWINFNTTQLSGLATQEELDNLTNDETNLDYEYIDITGGVSITKYTGTDTNLVIPDTLDGKKVLAIGDSSFSCCNSLTEIYIPDSVTQIGNWAFEWCSNLSEIDIPDSVTSVGKHAFSSCMNLANINIPDSVTSIDEYTFSNCSSLKEIHLPDFLTSIGSFAFDGCTSLEEINLPNSLTNIGIGSFESCNSLKEINLPNSLTNIGNSAFNSCRNLTNIDLPDSITSISPGTFYCCSNLTTINIPNTITSIGNEAFVSCTSLKTLNLPDSITSIGRYAFNGCFSLSSIQINSASTTIYNAATTIPQATTIIGYNPSTAKDYADSHGNPFQLIDDDSDQPTSISLNHTALDLIVSEIDTLTPIFYPTDVSNQSVTWSSSDSSIVTVDSNGNINAIKAGTATITATTANKLSAKCIVTVKSTEDDLNFTYDFIDGGICITGCTSDVSDMVIPEEIEDEPVLEISDWAFSDWTSLNSVVLPDSLVTLGEGAFSGCTNLSAVDLPESLAIIGSGAFRLCDNLSTVTLPNKLSSLGEGAFYSCKALKSIEIPASITTIYANTFKDCASLESITIPDNVKLVGYAAFLGCDDLVTIQFDSATTEIVDFANVIPEDTTIIGYYDSTAEEYAQKYDRNFKALDESDSDPDDSDDTDQVSISYQTHVQNVGWQDWKSDGTMSGTSGQSLRLEGIQIKINNEDNLGVEYQTHIQNIGWESDTNRGWKNDGEMSGTEGLSYRLEAIQIKLTGTDADKYDIYYHVHAQNVGWMGWAKNGESSGTAGYGYRLEGIEIKIVPKGDSAPSNNVVYANPYKENVESQYSSILQEYRTAASNGFSSSLMNSLPDVNSELFLSSSKSKLYYLLEDISGDSSPELVIAMYDPNTYSSVHQCDYQIYDVYRLNNGTPERVFDIYSMGYRAIYTLCEDQTVRCYGSGGVNAHSDTFYQLNGNKSSIIQTVTYDNPYYTLNDATHLNSTISKTEANEIINSYVPRTDINWIAL
ncbi:leucine-rich repeat protein [Eubacteriaceae bacterium ES2]|nr:leucine-rich repeat protein [Eubacteriaceae bacterium ES2]